MMSTLFVTGHWPHPLNAFNHGLAQRMRLLLRALQRFDDRLELLAFPPAGSGLAGAGGFLAERLRSDFQATWDVRVHRVHLAAAQPVQSLPRGLWHGYLQPIAGLRWQPAFAALSSASAAAAVRVALDLAQPDRVFAHRLLAMQPVRRAVTGLANPPLLYLDLDDIEHRAFARSLRSPPHWGAKRLQWAWLPALRAAERTALRHARRALVCSEADRDYLRATWHLDNIDVLPNAYPDVDADPLPATATVLFIGSHSYPPNRVAAEHLLQQIWPKVYATRPDAQLVIAGKGCELIEGFADPPPGVRFEGFVDDLRALYRRIRVVVCPILSGGGTRIKIIEAALYGRPIVSTTVGAEGLDLRGGGVEIELADDPTTFAQAVLRLLPRADEAASADAGAMAQRAAARARSLYSESAVLSRAAETMGRWKADGR